VSDLADAGADRPDGAERPAGAERPDLRLVDEARHRLLDMISSGALRPGDKLGTERELAAALSVSRSTLRQVLAVLAQSGVVRRVPGRAGGTFVAHSKVDRDLSVIVGLPEYLRRQGFVAGTQVLSATMTGADDLTATHLDLQGGSLVLDIVRIRLADGVPISLERVRLPADLVPGLLELPLGGSIYDLLDRHYGMKPQDVVEHLEVVEASPDEAALLGIADRAALLAITRTSRTADGVAFEFSNDLFRADRTCVTFRTKAERAEIIGRAAAERPPHPGGPPVLGQLGPGDRNAPAAPAESGLRAFSAGDRQGARR
jgi:GntR family transcriptional regulator